MLSQTNYLCGISGRQGGHLTSIVPPYQLMMMSNPEPQMLRKGRLPLALLKHRKNPRTELRVPILQWFQALTVEERQHVTEIHDSVIVEMAVRISGLKDLDTHKVSVDFSKTKSDSSLEQRYKTRLFPTRLLSDPKVQAENSLVEGTRLICIGRPALYLSASLLSDPERYFDWLSEISIGQIFKQSSSNQTSSRFTNPLWFSCYSFNSLGEWICSGLQQAMVKNYENIIRQSEGLRSISDQSSSLIWVSRLLKFCKSNSEASRLKSENGFQKWLSLQLKDSSSAEIEEVRKKFQIIQTLFGEETTKELMENINDTTTVGKKPKKASKKRRPAKKQTAQLIPPNAEVQVTSLPGLVEDQEAKVLRDNGLGQIELALSAQEDTATLSDNVLGEVVVSLERSEDRSQEQKIQELNQQQQNMLGSQERTQEQPVGQHALSHSTSDSLQQKKKRRHYNKRSRRRVPQQLIDGIYTEWLQTGLESFVDNLSIESNKMFQARILVFERIRYFVMKLHGEYTVDAKLFGSNSVGLALPTSDIDILLTGFNLQSQADCPHLLETLSIQLRKMKWVVDCTIYPFAKVPIVKLSVDPNIPFLSSYSHDCSDLSRLSTITENLEINKPISEYVSVDITIEAKKAESCHLGFKSTEFMKTSLEDTKYLHPIVLTLKYLLSEKRLNKPYKGGLNAYGLLILCAAYLKTYPDHPTLSQAFLNLLDFYSNVFDGETQTVSVFHNSTCFTQSPPHEGAYQSGISIVDPLNGRLMTANCTGFYMIKFQFRRVFNYITQLRQQIKTELREMDALDFKSLKEGKKKCRDKFLRRYQKNYTIRQILTQEE